MPVPPRVLILEDRHADTELMVHELRRAGFDPDWQWRRPSRACEGCCRTVPVPVPDVFAGACHAGRHVTGDVRKEAGTGRGTGAEFEVRPGLGTLRRIQVVREDAEIV